jgi:hypothetical protein
MENNILVANNTRMKARQILPVDCRTDPSSWPGLDLDESLSEGLSEEQSLHDILNIGGKWLERE